MEPRVFPGLVLLRLLVSARALEMIEQHAPGLTCSQGLMNCFMTPGTAFSAALPDARGADVTDLRLESVLCCSHQQNCQPCLQVIISVKELDDGEYVSMDIDDYEDEDDAVVKVVLSTSGSLEQCRALQLMFNTTEEITHQLLLTERVAFGSTLQVSVYSQRDFVTRRITFPSLSEVCSLNLEANIKECDVPRLRIVTDLQREVISLRLEKNNSTEGEVMFQRVWHEILGKVVTWPKDKEELIISSQSIVPCLCFKVWWKEKTVFVRQYCPFNNQQDAHERMQQHNVSVSMVESSMRLGGVLLSWNVTAPCTLEGEVWMCKKDQNGKDCEEVMGSRQELIPTGWKTTHTGYWHSGEFNGSSSPLLCVQMKIKGMRSDMEPQCPFTTPHSRRGLMLLVGFLLLCLAGLGIYLLQRLLRGYIWRWSKEDLTDVVGNTHVVLLCPPHADDRLPGLLCHLGSILQAVGFSVSLDLWSSTELSMLGPIPWFHSQLNRVQSQGGKVVLVLTPEACTRAEEWGASSWDRKTLQEGELSCSGSFPCVDVFSASLSCVLTDYLQGCAGERFMLVQFDSFAPEQQTVSQSLPQFFRGLHVYKLPSQSLGFLTELAGVQKGATVSSRWKRTGGLRKASHILAKMLSRLKEAETNVLHLPDVYQSCVGEEDGEEVKRPCLITQQISVDATSSTSLV